MTGEQAIDFAQEGIFLLLQVSGPLMAVGLAVGLAIALLQALTQVQEMTLVFVPKIVVILLTFLLMLPFMGQAFGVFMEGVMERIIGG